MQSGVGLYFCRALPRYATRGDSRAAVTALQARKRAQLSFYSLTKPLNLVSEFGVTPQKMALQLLIKMILYRRYPSCKIVHL
jgi:hypothetical protein